MFWSVFDALRWRENKLISEGFNITGRGLLHNNQHGYLTASKDGRDESWYITYKTQYFKKFSRQFQMEDNSMGESLNLEAYQAICDRPYGHVVFAHPAEVFEIRMEDLRRYVQKHNTLRRQHNQNEDTVSVDIRELNQVYSLKPFTSGGVNTPPSKQKLVIQCNIQTW